VKEEEWRQFSHSLVEETGPLLGPPGSEKSNSGFSKKQSKMQTSFYFKWCYSGLSCLRPPADKYLLIQEISSWPWWLMTIMLATQEAEIRKMSSKPAQANNS
jgi:hypothetical protein